MWTSGLRSPVYCDNRVTLSFPEARTYITEQMVSVIRSRFPEVQAIAGVATAGIAQGALIASALNLPFAYVRPEPKKHGLQNSIEGRLDAGAKVVVIEDLISTGKSSLKAVADLRENNIEVLGLLSIFNYGFPETDARFISESCPYVSLCNFKELSSVASNTGYISQSDFEKVSEWSADPKAWSEKN